MMKTLTTIAFLMMFGLSWGQTPSFDYEVEYEYSGIDELDGDSLFSISCIVEVNENISQIELKIGTAEGGSEILNAVFDLGVNLDVSLNQDGSEATIYLGEFPQFDKFFNVKLHYLDGVVSSAVSKSILFNIPQN